MDATITFDASEPVAKLSSLAARVMAAVLETGQVVASRAEALAKGNAVWTDRTTHARQGLTGKAVLQGTRLVVYLVHSMSYGLWLEVAMQKRYAIIMGSLQTVYPMLVRLLSLVLKGF